MQDEKPFVRFFIKEIKKRLKSTDCSRPSQLCFCFLIQNMFLRYDCTNKVILMRTKPFSSFKCDAIIVLFLVIVF